MQAALRTKYFIKHYSSNTSCTAKEREGNLQKGIKFWKTDLGLRTQERRVLVLLCQARPHTQNTQK